MRKILQQYRQERLIAYTGVIPGKVGRNGLLWTYPNNEPVVFVEVLGSAGRETETETEGIKHDSKVFGLSN